MGIPSVRSNIDKVAAGTATAIIMRAVRTTAAWTSFVILNPPDLYAFNY
jgi:hypothetical protein